MRTKQKIMKKMFNLLAVVFITTAFLSSGASAESFQSAQSVSFTFDPSLTVTQTTSTVAINSLTPGTYNNSNINYVTVTSNAVGGYSLISNVTGNGASTTQLRITPTSDTYKFTSLTSNTASLSSFTDNYWGYSYCIGNSSTCTASAGTWISGNAGSTSTGYNGYASTSTNVTHVSTSASGTSTIGYKIGARASSTQAAGTYTNKVVFTAAAKVITTSYTINYNSNGGTSVSSQSGTSTTGAVQLSSTVPTKSDYVFRGWCTVDNTSDPTTCTGTNAEIIQAGNLLGLNTASSSVTKTLYAVWKDDSTPIEMQNATLADCGKTMIDSRDGEKYATALLADGKCWMLDNLRLDLSNSTVLNNTTESNTNASTTTLNYLKNGGGSTSDRYPTAKINNVPWTSSDQNYYSIPMTISTYKDQTTTSYGEGSGKIGVYYNYCAASAGNYCFGNGKSQGSPSGNATEDICPKGWRMPTGDSSGEYKALYTAYSSDAANFRNALSTPLSGYFRSGSAHDQGTGGYFWSSTYSDTGDMYRLRVDSSNVHPSNNDDRYRGFSVRCIFGT